MALSLAAHGATVVALARSAGQLGQTVELGSKAGGTATPLVVDPGELEQITSATKAALEALTLNLAAELDGSGVMANVPCPRMVDPAMQAFVHEQDHDRVGGQTVARFRENAESRSLISTERSAASLVARLATQASGQVRDVDDDLTKAG